MTPEKIVILMLLIGFCSCSDIAVTSTVETQVTEKKSSGFSIENGLRQGILYVDSTGTEYIYYSVTSTITNDSTIPMHFVVDFAKATDLANDSLGPRVFLQPRRALTQEKLQTINKSAISLSISNDIKHVLAMVAQTPTTLDTLLSSKGKCVMTFGLLNNTKHAEPYAIGLQVSGNGSSATELELKFDNITPEKHYVVPCGQINFENIADNLHNR
ncbi:hypothetical protein CNR22_15100 [Sphingobacteriaceae bacterium]|nr:hypothetical protein CNR22_15100 [Sphingobacteriaceae bacterium]